MIAQVEALRFPFRQSVSTVELTQVPEAIGWKIGAFPVENRSAENAIPTAKARRKLAKEMQAKYWWLDPTWQQKSPVEQVLVGTPRVAFDIYNFSEKLTDEEVEKFRKTASIFSQLKRDTRLLSFLVSDEQSINPNNNKPLNGIASSSGTVVIEPNARRQIPYGIEEIDNLTGTLVHEGGHFFVNSQKGLELLARWRAEMGWVDDVRHVGTPDSIGPVSDYAKISSHEDFVDSLVAAVFARSRLDQKRLDFLDKELGTDRVELDRSDAVVVRRTGAEIIIPKVNQVFYYSRRPLGTFTRR